MKKVVFTVVALAVMCGQVHAKNVKRVKQKKVEGNVVVGEKMYALVEKNDKKWELKKLSLEKPVWEKETQEILEVSRNGDLHFLPSYEPTSEWQYLGRYSYQVLSSEPASISDVTYSCKLRSDKTKYTPCNSSLTSFINTDFFGLFGGSRYSFQTGKMSKLLFESNLDAEVKACREKNLSYAQDALQSFLSVEPKIVDLSGTYDKSKLYDIVPANYDCLVGTNDIVYNIEPKRDSPYIFEIDMKGFPICKDGAACNVTPTVTIQSKNVNGLTVKDTFADGIVSVTLDNISDDSGDSVMTYTLTNLSRNSVQVENVSLYIDDAIIKAPIKMTWDLDPKQQIKNAVLRGGTDNATRHKVAFPYAVKDQGKKISIGVAVKYNLEGVQKTMFETKEYTLKKLLKDI